jgi:hypothetical protein
VAVRRCHPFKSAPNSDQSRSIWRTGWNTAALTQTLAQTLVLLEKGPLPGDAFLIIAFALHHIAIDRALQD